MSAWKDTRKPIMPRGIHQTTDAAAFVHEQTQCPCEPWTLTVSSDDAAIQLVMHRPVTQRGQVKKRPLLGNKWARIIDAQLSKGAKA